MPTIIDERHVFPDGRVAVLLRTDAPAHPDNRKPLRESVRWEDMGGVITGWGKVERIEYAPTLGEQYLAQRTVVAM